MDNSLVEAPCLERLLGLKLTTDLRWNSYILSVAKEASKMVGSFFRSKSFLTPAAILYLYKSQIRPIWNTVVISGQEPLKRLFPAFTEYKAVFATFLGTA